MCVWFEVILKGKEMEECFLFHLKKCIMDDDDCLVLAAAVVAAAAIGVLCIKLRHTIGD